MLLMPNVFCQGASLDFLTVDCSYHTLNMADHLFTIGKWLHNHNITVKTLRIIGASQVLTYTTYMMFVYLVPPTTTLILDQFDDAHDSNWCTPYGLLPSTNGEHYTQAKATRLKRKGQSNLVLPSNIKSLRCNLTGLNLDNIQQIEVWSGAREFTLIDHGLDFDLDRSLDS